MELRSGLRPRSTPSAAAAPSANDVPPSPSPPSSSAAVASKKQIDAMNKTEETERAQLETAIAAALEQAAALSKLREKFANGAELNDIKSDLNGILYPRQKERSEGKGEPGGNTDNVHEMEDARCDNENDPDDRLGVDDMDDMEVPPPPEGEEAQEVLVNGMTRDLRGDGEVSFGIDVIDVYPSGMVVCDDEVGYIAGSEGDTAWVEYYCGASGHYRGLGNLEGSEAYETLKLLRKYQSHGISREAHLMHSMLEMNKCKKALKIAHKEISRAQFTDTWQGRFDQLALLAEAAGVDKVQIQAIRCGPISGTKRTHDAMSSIDAGRLNSTTLSDSHPRFSGPQPSEMTPEQLSLRDSILSSRPTTGLSGPFGPWLAIPAIATPAQQLGQAVRYNTSLSKRESELVILLTGAKYESVTEFDIHTEEARVAGVGLDVIRSIPRKGFSLETVKEFMIPSLIREHEEYLLSAPPANVMTFLKAKECEVAAVLFASELLHTNTVCNETYEETKRVFGGRDSVLVEITAIVGYYAFVSYTLNVFKIPSPSVV